MNIIEWILNSLGTILFCTGLSLFILMADQSEKLFKSIAQSKKETIVYETYKEPEEIVITYAQVIATLFTTIDYDIQIDDLYISRVDYDGMDSKINIKETDYKRSYVYDGIGNITKVVYQSIE